MTSYVPLARHKNDKSDYERARGLRKTSPIAENLLWNALRVLRKTNGLKFRRQHPLHPYIADFVCLKLKPVIELDGMSHDMRQQEDDKRDARLREMGYLVLRFPNEEVYRNLEGIVMTVVKTARDQAKILFAPLPCPLPQGEGNP
jgi:very-short-patch-repair endonuclease